MTTTQPITLGTADTDDRRMIGQLFGLLLDLAQPVEHYRSDLYHDALQLGQRWTRDGFSFLFGVRSTGTDLMDDDYDGDLATLSPFMAHNEHIYRIQVWPARRPSGNTFYKVQVFTLR
jgi:hypothetical protein